MLRSPGLCSLSEGFCLLPTSLNERREAQTFHPQRFCFQDKWLCFAAFPRAHCRDLLPIRTGSVSRLDTQQKWLENRNALPDRLTGKRCALRVVARGRQQPHNIPGPSWSTLQKSAL